MSDWASSIVSVGNTTPVGKTDWTVEKSTKEGYTASGWVYRAIRLIASNAATVRFSIVDRDGATVENHPVKELLDYPSDQYPIHQLIELLVTWLQLTGKAYLYQNKVNGKTVELWPISPDKIRPIRSRDPSIQIEGYEEATSGGFKRSTQFTPDNVIYLRLANPSDPIDGISPLHAAALQVDLDKYQIEWNASASANRAVVDGVITFKQEIPDRSTFDALRERIREVWSGRKAAREPMILGNEAQYHRLGLTPAEMDFVESRRFNRDEILAIFGVPSVLVNNDSSATYNNYSSAVRIFWETTVVPILQSMAGGFEVGLEEYLKDGERIVPDLSSVDALRDHLSSKLESAEIMSRIGVPLAEINRRLKLGLELDESAVEPDQDQRSFAILKRARIDTSDVQTIRDEFAENTISPKISRILQRQFDMVVDRIEEPGSIVEVIESTREDMLRAIESTAIESAILIAKSMNRSGRSVRATDEYFEAEVTRLLLLEEWINSDESNIHKTTAANISRMVGDAMSAGITTQELKEQINESGIFSPVRALRIARTIGGTGASYGQLAAAELTGAKRKIWVSADDSNVRSAHRIRHDEERDIDEKFSLLVGFVAPRFPLDPRIDPSDRVNCRCSMTFDEG